VRDPEAKLRTYGPFFGKIFKLPSWLDEAPRVRVRTISQRAKDDLVELAVLNERLHGDVSPWEARSRLELLRKKRKNWEHIYNYVTKADAAATLALIEEANEQVCTAAQPGCPPDSRCCHASCLTLLPEPSSCAVMDGAAAWQRT
jgi:chlorophyllide a oxygenase